MKQTIVYFVRHGTIENPGTIPGDYDFNLNSKGKAEIQKAANWLSNKDISAIYSSPIKRTLESAEIIQKKFLSLRINKSFEIREWIRPWRGKAYEKVIKTREWQVYLNNPTKLTGYQDLKGLSKRMLNFLKKLLKKHSAKEIVCVTHRDPIVALRLKLERKPLDLLNKISCERGSINILYFNGGKLNKIRYVEPE
ncbi:MAG: histidine phosphatase family protein [Candidatus Woesearchaeota archaeon]|nr:histidine phosphatase family protein [Candidatus Woesearchaeota archaeon]